MSSTTTITTHVGSMRLASRPLSLPARGAPRLRLLPSGDGWSLIDDNGRLVFSALGLGGRLRCLEYAQAHGVVALAR